MARCKHTGTRRQCQFQAIEGSVYCAKHSNEADRVKGYKLQDPELRARFEELGREDSLDTIKQEVLLLRILIEDRLNFCKNAAERTTALQGVTSALATIDKLVNSLCRLQRVSSLTLDKPALSRLSTRIIEILLENLGDLPDRDEIVDRVAAEIAQAIVDARNED